MEQELQGQAEGILGYIMYFILSGVVLLLAKSTIESLVESIKVFWGKDLNTDDVVILNGRPARVVRVGMWKTIFFVYDVDCIGDKPIIKGGSKMAIQNDQVKNHTIVKPLPMLDLSKWDCKKEKD